MGWSWLEAESQKMGQAGRSIADTHPLYMALNGRTEDSVLEVLSVASYLFAFRDDARLGDSILALREAHKYRPAIIELDFAWKFRNAGANVTLFPPTPKGTADFAAIINDIKFIVETSGFPSDTLRDDGMSFLSAMSASFVSAVRKSNIPIPMSLELKVSEVSGNARSAVHTGIKEVVRAFDLRGSTSPLEQSYDFGTIVVRPTIPGEHPSPTKGWTQAQRLGQASLSESKLLGETDYSIVGAGSWAYLCDKSANADPYERIRGKLKQEARQLSGCRDGLIIIDIEVFGLEVINNREKLEPVIRDFFRNHSSTTAVAIVVRPVKMNGQRGVSGHYFTGAESALSVQFWNSVESIDRGVDLFNELRGATR
jgi:hypothetical protein